MKKVASLMSRDKRQAISMQRWINSNGHGTLVCATGYGKSRVATNIINWLQERHPDINIMIVVPTKALKEQWKTTLEEQKCLIKNIKLMVINGVIKKERHCDLLILDEAHRYPANTFRKVFDTVYYSMILCLTATFERLDGKHAILAKYAPMVDTVTVEECLLNHWISNYKEYVVVVEAEDMSEYNKLTKSFTEHFEFFDYNFGLVMSMIGPGGWKRRQSYARELCSDPRAVPDMVRTVTLHAMGVLRTVQARKKYIYSHPEKIRLAEEIIAHRPDKKIVTFSATVNIAEKFKEGYVYTGKESKKKGRISLDEFNKMSSGVLNTCRLAEEG